MDALPALQRLADRVHTARALGAALDIRGGDTKRFYGEVPSGEPLETHALAGIVAYEPSELVVTARGGTRLAELEAALAEHGQYLPFEPPRFSALGGEDGRDAGAAADGRTGGTVGGMVAAGLAGPARAAVGGVRDYVLGAVLLNGRGEALRFGGQVMKNVAGYDISRSLAGSMGVLGVICEVSLKVLPIVPASTTLCFDCTEAEAIERTNAWVGRPLPLSATAWHGGVLRVRCSGARAAVAAAAASMGGEALDAAVADRFWEGVRDQSNAFFADARAAADAGRAVLWRLAVPPTTPPLDLPGTAFLEWNGGQRWLLSEAPAARMREAAGAAGGHATMFVARHKSAGVFSPPSKPIAAIQARLKAAFDPDGVFNRSRLFPER